MDYKIKIGSALAPKELTVSKDDTIRGLLTTNNIAFKDGEVTLNGGVLGTAELNKTLSELNIADGDFILVNSKQRGGTN